MNTREFYEARAKAIIKELREEKRISYRDLATLLDMRSEGSEQVLINRINRGRFTFAFALQLLAAMDVQTLPIPRPPKPPAKPKK